MMLIQKIFMDCNRLAGKEREICSRNEKLPLILSRVVGSLDCFGNANIAPDQCCCKSNTTCFQHG